MRLRHHCRTCGKCVCHDCSPNQLLLNGQLQRACTPCVANGAGAMELLPALRYLREQICRMSNCSSDLASLPEAKHPAQAIAECVAAVQPKSFPDLQSDAETVETTLQKQLQESLQHSNTLQMHINRLQSQNARLENELKETRQREADMESRMQAHTDSLETDQFLNEECREHEHSHLVRSLLLDNRVSPDTWKDESTRNDPSEALTDLEKKHEYERGSLVSERAELRRSWANLALQKAHVTSMLERFEAGGQPKIHRLDENDEEFILLPGQGCRRSSARRISVLVDPHNHDQCQDVDDDHDNSSNASEIYAPSFEEDTDCWSMDWSTLSPGANESASTTDDSSLEQQIWLHEQSTVKLNDTYSNISEEMRNNAVT